MLAWSAALWQYTPDHKVCVYVCEEEMDLWIFVILVLYPQNSAFVMTVDTLK